MRVAAAKKCLFELKRLIEVCLRIRYLATGIFAAVSINILIPNFPFLAILTL